MSRAAGILDQVVDEGVKDLANGSLDALYSSKPLIDFLLNHFESEGHRVESIKFVAGVCLGKVEIAHHRGRTKQQNDPYQCAKTIREAAQALVEKFGLEHEQVYNTNRFTGDVYRFSSFSFSVRGMHGKRDYRAAGSLAEGVKDLATGALDDMSGKRFEAAIQANMDLLDREIEDLSVHVNPKSMVATATFSFTLDDEEDNGDEYVWNWAEEILADDLKPLMEHDGWVVNAAEVTGVMFDDTYMVTCEVQGYRGPQQESLKNLAVTGIEQSGKRAIVYKLARDLEKAGYRVVKLGGEGADAAPAHSWVTIQSREDLQHDDYHGVGFREEVHSAMLGMGYSDVDVTPPPSSPPPQVKPIGWISVALIPSPSLPWCS